MPTDQKSIFAKVSWHRGTFNAETEDELDAILDRVTREIDPELPQDVVVERSNGDALTVLLGAPQSFVNFIAASGNPPYFVSLGNPTAEGVITFYVNGDHHSEAHARHGIAVSQAREAARQFVKLRTGLPTNVTWTEV
jgi:hypothetical protein